MEYTFIEARINEYKMRDANPNVPWTEDEIVAEAVRVREKGATVLHYHARCPDGSPNNLVRDNGRIIKRVHENTGMLIHITLGFYSNDEAPEQRIQNVIELCSDPATRPEIAAIDPGTLNLESYDAVAKKVYDADNIYVNSTATNMKQAKVFSDLDLTVQFFCWGPSFVRRGAMLMDLGLIKNQPYFVYHLTGGRNISCNMPTKLGIDSMREAMPPDGNVPWAVAGGECNLFELAPYICKSGGHFCIGLGDHSYAEYGQPTNAELVEKLANVIQENGRQVASLEKTREILKITR